VADLQEIFYTSISRYYSDIFPYNPLQLAFIQHEISSLSGKKVLDIGCASGELSIKLAKNGANVTGIDLNADLLKQAKQKEAFPNLTFSEGNMLNLKLDFQENQFDAVICFGNTLVHLHSPEEVRMMLSVVRHVLKPGGNLLLQILNYDYIIENQVHELPLIETENIRFIRNYVFEENAQHIQFITELHVKKEGLHIQNETKLLALKSSQLSTALSQSGFSEINLYSNFKCEPFGGKHLPLVAACR